MSIFMTDDGKVGPNSIGEAVEADFFVTLCPCDASLGGLVYASTILLSRQQVYIHSIKQFPIGSQIDLIIEITNRSNVELPIKVRAEVVKYLPSGFVMNFLEFEDREQVHMLENIILFHSENPVEAARRPDKAE